MFSMVNANDGWTNCYDKNINPYFQEPNIQALSVDWDEGSQDPFILFNTNSDTVDPPFTRASKLVYVIQNYDGSTQLNRRDYVGVTRTFLRDYYIYVVLYDEDPFKVRG
ncbi:2950_t:CDS:2, partial [Scutellospora calospora]